MIKLNKCGDDKTIPKETHDKIKSCTNSIMDFDQDVKWYDVYSMFEEIFKDGKKLATEKSPIWFYDTFWSYDQLVEELEKLKEKFNILDSDITSHLGNSGEEWQLNVLSTDTIPNYTTDELKKGETNE